MAKQTWRLINNPQLLIARVIKARYPTLLDRERGGQLRRPSWGPRSFQEGFQTLLQGLVWKVGNGQSIRLREDRWVDGDWASVRSDVREGDVPPLVSSLLDTQSFAWDVALVRRLFDQETADRILALDLPGRPMDDFVYWKFSRDGKFAVKSAYAMLSDRRHLVGGRGDFPSGWWKKFWGLHILPRWKVFIWRLLSGGLPVGEVLVQHGISVYPGCPFCGQASESVDYLFPRPYWLSSPLGRFITSSSGSFRGWCVGNLMSMNE